MDRDPAGGGGGVPKATLSPSERFCIKMGTDESHFIVSLIVKDTVTRRRRKQRSRVKPD